MPAAILRRSRARAITGQRTLGLMAWR